MTRSEEPEDEAAGRPAIPKRQRRLMVLAVAAAVAGLIAAWLFARLPDYLLVATPPVKADAVVLLGGGSFQARERMADELMAQGMAKFLVVPSAGEVYEAQVSRALVTPEKTAAITDAVRQELARAYVEQTHVEIHQAHALLQHIGASRAILVSSPYHMRRIALMAGRVFDARYTLAFVPTPYDPPHAPWFTSWQDVKWVVSEYVKILWFFVYSPFV